MTECIFCKIAAGEIPATKVYEDEQVLAFMDINPLTRGHCLLICKAHYEDVFSIPEDLLRDVAAAAQRLAGAVKAGVGAEGINLLQSNGRAANQIIPHYHLHLVPRWSKDGIRLAEWEMKGGDPEDLAAAAEAIRKRL